MPRYKLTIEYDGSPFSGWQVQSNGVSVQGRLQEAVFALSGEHTVVYGAGRTDAGVHALGQVAHVDVVRAYPTDVVRDALNAHLRPDPISIIGAEIVAADFHARFGAIRRCYRYRILNRRSPPALDLGRVWHVMRRLDEFAMQRGAQSLLGLHDFTTFRSAHCQAASPMKTLDGLDVRRAEDVVIVVAEARSFLHHQVRSLVGSLKLIGEGQWAPSEIKAALDARDRSRCGPVAPAAGLTLMRVDYPPAPDLPSERI